MSKLLHITTPDQWRQACLLGEYRAPSLESEGFIHCSKPDQLLVVANTLYAGQADLLLLVIDPERVKAIIRYEDCYETGQMYPHIYGPVPLAAVRKVLDLPVRPNGTFAMPPGF